jgi:hypothetical protein
MAITYTWTIAQLERTTADGGVTVAHWRVSASETVDDVEYAASSYGSVGFTPDASAEGFVAFDALTETDVLAWVWGSVDQATTEKSLASIIESKKAPVVSVGLPW